MNSNRRLRREIGKSLRLETLRVKQLMETKERKLNIMESNVDQRQVAHQAIISIISYASYRHVLLFKLRVKNLNPLKMLNL
jgi:hypothetical protein